MNLIDPNEIERYHRESLFDYLALVVVMLMLIASVIVIAWNPDVEAIGTWISNIINPGV